MSFRDLSLSVVGMGCWAIGRTYWGDDVDDAVSTRAIHAALDGKSIARAGRGFQRGVEGAHIAIKLCRYLSFSAVRMAGEVYRKLGGLAGLAGPAGPARLRRPF